ncbi:ABC transporter G family member 33-like [Gossypium australe]|uniref:ABC transporter G family member 33-like n=1 Tax=Gossypium australe TaxID=47621 RepID=A0A5B6WHP1_9ROSI|nr:ABC transporter G family member 33-like [Gossypium australe]
MLRRYRSDPSHVVPVEEIEVRSDLSFEEEPVQILDRDVKVFRRKTILLVKVLWWNHDSEEASWEPEDEMKDIVKVIIDRLKAGFDRQISYADLKHRDIGFVVGDKVFIKFLHGRKYYKLLDLLFEELSVEILAYEVKKLRNKHVPLVKVLWRSHSVEEATWELEEMMRSQYSHLFLGKFWGQNFLSGENCNDPKVSGVRNCGVGTSP